MVDKYVSIDASGNMQEVEGTVTSAGAGDAGEIVALDGAGKLDNSVMPVGIGADEITIEFTETASAGDLINIFDVTGTAKARLADASNGRVAHGYAPSAVTSPASGAVRFEGEITGQTGLTIGAKQFLGTAGAMTETPPTTSTHYLQIIGYARDATTVDFEPAQPIIRA